MTVYVALLRGINVGGRHSVPMADLRALFEAQGCARVSTYIQSGNVIFESERAEDALIAALVPPLHERFGFEIPVVLRDRAALQAAARRHPLADAQPEERFLHVCFLASAPAAAAIAAFEPDPFLPDRFAVEGREVYIAFAHGAGRSKLTVDAIERGLGSTCTGRNWRTVTKLAELAAAAG